MYTNNDVITLKNLLDKHLIENNIQMRQSVFIIDISFLKSFNSSILHDIFNRHIYTKIEESLDTFEETFISACLGVILNSKQFKDIYVLTIDIINKLEDKLNDMCIPVYIDRSIKKELILYIDVLRNNLERTLEMYGFNNILRLCFDSLEDIDKIHKSYIISDFVYLATNGVYTQHSLCISTYERI